MDGYTLETVNFGRGRGVAIYIQNGVNYSLLPLVSNDCSQSGHMVQQIVVFRNEMNNITAQSEFLDTDHTVLWATLIST